MSPGESNRSADKETTLTSVAEAQTKPNAIYHGDCIVGMKQLPTACVDLLFADPPFNIGYEYDQYDDHQSAEDYLDWSRKWMPEAVRLLKPNGTLWLAIGDEYAAELKMILQRRCKLICRSWVIWYYTFGQNCKTNFSRSHTHLFYMAKDPKQCTFNVAEIRVPSARQLVYNDDRGNPDGRLPDNTWILRPQDAPESFNPTDDVWHVPRVNGTFRERQGFHGCQMPEQILGRIIRACSNPGDLVLDPFAGSGTTPAVAKKLGRRFIGFELSTDYAARAQRRVATAREGQPLEGSENPLLPASSRTRQATEADSRQIDLF